MFTIILLILTNRSKIELCPILDDKIFELMVDYIILQSIDLLLFVTNSRKKSLSVYISHFTFTHLVVWKYRVIYQISNPVIPSKYKISRHNTRI